MIACSALVLAGGCGSSKLHEQLQFVEHLDAHIDER